MGIVTPPARLGDTVGCLNLASPSSPVPIPRPRFHAGCRDLRCKNFLQGDYQILDVQHPLEYLGHCRFTEVMFVGYNDLWDAPADTQTGMYALKKFLESPHFWIPQSSALVLAACAALYLSRPRGWADLSLLEVRPSRVQGMGVFFLRDLPARTLLGSYPGRPRAPHNMAAKAQRAPASREYAFCAPCGAWLDPTDEQGRVSAFPRPGLPWFAVDTSLARVNEPPIGFDVNVEVVTEGDPLELRFVTLREVVCGEEAFIDYGPSYDRSLYGQP
eukprot:jgi/Botrbrau1/22627/Bobra.176_1s0054.1